jgi:hypothetical protein
MNIFSLVVSGLRKSLWSPRGFFKEKQMGFSKPLPMAEVKAVKNALGCSINDLMLACVHSAVVKYAESKDAMKDTEFTYLVPTSLRARGDISLTNQSSGWLLPLPALNSSTALLPVVRKRMNTLKMSLEPYIYFWSQRLTGRYPWLVPMPDASTKLGRLWKVVGKTVSAITNVPGPSQRLNWGGEEYTRYIPCIPCASPNGLGLAIASYADGIALGINMDLDEGGDGLFAKGDGFVIARLFEKAFEELKALAKEKAVKGVKAEAGKGEQ